MFAIIVFIASPQQSKSSSHLGSCFQHEINGSMSLLSSFHRSRHVQNCYNLLAVVLPKKMETPTVVVDLEDLQVPGADPTRLEQAVVLPKR